MNIFEKKNEESRQKFRRYCRPEILALTDKNEPVTVKEFLQFRTMNGYEQHLLFWNASLELLILMTKKFLGHCKYQELTELSTAVVYDEVVIGLLVPKILKHLEVEHKQFPSSERPVRDKDLNGEELDMSVDVITINEDGMMDIGWYNYDLDDWGFHTDTLTDRPEGSFVWMYKPENFKFKKS